MAEQAQFPLQRDLRYSCQNRPRAGIFGQHPKTQQQPQSDRDQRQEIAVPRHDHIVQHELKADRRRDDNGLHQE